MCHLPSPVHLDCVARWTLETAAAVPKERHLAAVTLYDVQFVKTWRELGDDFPHQPIFMLAILENIGREQICKETDRKEQ